MKVALASLGLFYCTIIDGLSIKFTPELLVTEYLYDEVDAIISSASLTNPFNFLCLLSSYSPYNFQKHHYLCCKEEGARLDILMELTERTELHPLLFPVAKLIEVPELASRLFNRVSYNDDLSVSTMSGSIGTIKAFSCFPCVQTSLVRALLESQLHTISNLNWLHEFVGAAHQKIVIKLLKQLTMMDMFPEMLLPFWERFSGQVPFLTLYLKCEEGSKYDCLVRLLIVHTTAAISSHGFFSAFQGLIVASKWELLINSVGELATSLKTFISQFFSLSPLDGDLSETFSKSIDQLITLQESVSGVSLWGLIGSLLLLCKPNRGVTTEACKAKALEYLTLLDPSRIAPFLLRKLTHRYVDNSNTSLKSRLLETFPVTYLSLTILPVEQVRSMWLQSGPFDLATEEEFIMRSLDDFAHYIVKNERIPLNAWLQTNGDGFANVGAAILAESRSCLNLLILNDLIWDTTDDIPVLTSLMYIFASFPYLLQRGIKEDLSLFFPSQIETDTWQDLLTRVHWGMERKEPVLFFNNLLYASKISQYFTVKAFRCLVDSSFTSE